MNSKGGILEELGLVKKKHIKINSNDMLAYFFFVSSWNIKHLSFLLGRTWCTDIKSIKSDIIKCYQMWLNKNDKHKTKLAKNITINKKTVIVFIIVVLRLCDAASTPIGVSVKFNATVVLHIYFCFYTLGNIKYMLLFHNT